ncbi:hypothetical protein TI39_contig352g00040 [Zymoseptoria brevis]|uniref:Uncharacterized protein n=1 Tax=Zymoseptoria brevis TaxID=1047168 RepID=A0A0F4GRR6_9PEZI|nr:hypothetical protein TI39_contig352g00040 [Zymoseptoria brevis]
MPFGAIRGGFLPSSARLQSPRYAAVKEYDENERQSSFEETNSDTFDRPGARGNRWRDLVRMLLLGITVFMTAFAGTSAANAFRIAGCQVRKEHHFRNHAASAAVSVPEKGTRIPFLENVPMKPSNFTPDELLGLPALLESNKAWDALIGPSKGYIEIAHPEQYGLPPGVRHPTDPDKSVYGLAMTHQLHCLIRIRKIYYDFVDGRLTAESFHASPPLELTGILELNHGSLHLNHCFDYLQEGIRCAAHMDVQYPDMANGVGILTGERMCKDWTHVYGILNEHAFDASNMTL